MKFFLSGILMLCAGLTGCVTKAEADARARIAFLEGQNQALMRMQGSQGTQQPEPQTPAGPSVNLVGPVQNSTVPWRPGLMLSQAIVSAHYTLQSDPTMIVIHRNGQDIPINPKGLLNGEDFGLQAGDSIEIRP